MKKIVVSALAAAALVFPSCQKMPSVVDADGEFLVSTSYAEGTDFSKYASFTVADSVVVLQSRLAGEKVRNSFTDELVGAYRQMMEENGFEYVPVDEKEKADLGIQLTYVADTDYYIDYVDPYWWLDYPGYWSSYYWGAWGGGWYYPYPVMYEFSTHSLMADMADLTAASGEDERIPVLWSCMINGNAGSARTDYARFMTAIRQAFAQSPYLSRISE